MKAFVRMSSGVDLREVGWNGDGTGAGDELTEKIKANSGITQDNDGDMRFADWNCRAGQNNIVIRTDGTLAPCFPLYPATCDWEPSMNSAWSTINCVRSRKAVNSNVS